MMSYLVGSIPCGLLLAQGYTGKLINTKGSKNIGTTNALRVAGKSVGVATMLCDIFKGALPAMLALNLFPDDINIVLLCAILAILGHMFPVWLKFKGGKGIATSLGAMLIIEPSLATLAISVFAIIAIPFRVISVASLSSTLIVAISAFFFSQPETATFLIIVTGLIFLKHKDNINRIFKGEEKKLF